MAQGVQTVKQPAKDVVVQSGTGLLNMIEQHRKTVLSTPFVLAAALILLYVFAGNEFRQVLDFFSPTHILGR
jgi:hypothetical protein